MTTPTDIETFFFELRHSSSNHLGLGDIRLTLGDQLDIVSTIREQKARIEVLEKAITAAIKVGGTYDCDNYGCLAQPILKSALAKESDK